LARKSVPVSVRLEPGEAAFLAGLEIGDAHTHSEKLRAIIAAARQRQLGTEDYRSALRVAQKNCPPQNETS